MALLEARTSQHIHIYMPLLVSLIKKWKWKKNILRLDSVDRKKSALLIFYMPSKSTIVNLINILTGVYSIHSIQRDTHTAHGFSRSLITVQAARKLEFVMISFHFTSLHFFALFGGMAHCCYGSTQNFQMTMTTTMSTSSMMLSLPLLLWLFLMMAMFTFLCSRLSIYI